MHIKSNKGGVLTKCCQITPKGYSDFDNSGKGRPHFQLFAKRQVDLSRIIVVLTLANEDISCRYYRHKGDFPMKSVCFAEYCCSRVFPEEKTHGIRTMTTVCKQKRIWLF